MMLDLQSIYQAYMKIRFDEVLGKVVDSPLTQIINSPGFRLMNKDVVDRAVELKEILEGLPDGRMSVYEAQKAITAANNLKSKVPSLDNQIADFMRKQLNETMDSLADSRYSNLKAEYGHIRAIEESVSKAAFSDMTKGSGLWEATDIFSLGEIAKGMVGGNKAALAKGLVSKFTQKAYQKLNNPNAKIKKMFEKADKIYNRVQATPVKEADSIYANAINKNIDDAIKQLEGQKVPLALPEGAIRMGGPSPEPPPTIINLPSKLSEFKSLKSMGKTDDGLFRWTDDVSKTGFTTKTDSPDEIRQALKKTRELQKNRDFQMAKRKEIAETESEKL